MTLRNSRSAAQWARLIAAAWQKGVESIFETGRMLIEAKAELGENEKWMPLFEEKRLPFGLRTAERLMEIARNPVLADSSNWTNLPPYWRTIHLASQLDAEILSGALADGTIHPEVQGSDIQLLVNRTSRAKRFASMGAAPMPDDQSHVIYCDPPWEFKVWRESSAYGAALEHYPTMSLDDICALPIGDRAPGDAILFMWTTAPMLREAFTVMDAWGFEYKTHMMWDKEKQGMGYYVRNQHEPLLIATRGDFPTPDPNDKSISVIREPKGGHSAKPLVFYDIIDRMYPPLRKREFFARYWRPGWLKPWGNVDLKGPGDSAPEAQ